jgi:hypothetical protein
MKSIFKRRLLSASVANQPASPQLIIYPVAPASIGFVFVDISPPFGSSLTTETRPEAMVTWSIRLACVSLELGKHNHIQFSPFAWFG